MTRSPGKRTFGAEEQPEIAEEHLTEVGGSCKLRPEFVHEDIKVTGGSFVTTEAGSGRVSHALLSNVDLRESRLRGVRLVDVKASSLEASSGDWRGSHLRRVLLSGCRLTGLVLSEAKLEDVTFRGCKLDYANLRFAELTRVTFEDCVLVDTDCQGMRCEESRFTGCRMHGTDFSKAELDGADLRGSDLRLTGGVEALRGAVVSTSQVIDLAIPLAAAAGISVRD